MTEFFQRLGQYGDVLFALAVITILAVVIIPMPVFLMDILLTLNIALTLIVLLMTLYVTRPLELSVFPGLLLVITLFRLSLNVATTRILPGKISQCGSPGTKRESPHRPG